MIKHAAVIGSIILSVTFVVLRSRRTNVPQEVNKCPSRELGTPPWDEAADSSARTTHLGSAAKKKSSFSSWELAAVVAASGSAPSSELCPSAHPGKRNQAGKPPRPWKLSRRANLELGTGSGSGRTNPVVQARGLLTELSIRHSKGTRVAPGDGPGIVKLLLLLCCLQPRFEHQQGSP